MSFRVRLGLGLGLLWAAASLLLFPSVAGSVLDRQPGLWSPLRVPDWFRDGRFATTVALAAGAFAVTLLGVLLVQVLRMVVVWRTPPVDKVGVGKWGGLGELQEAKLVGQEGVVVGRCGDGVGGLLAYDGPEHHLVVGATRAGKGVGHVIPTLLAWRHSAVVYDIKGELWETTAGFRGRFGHVLRFAPTRADSCRFNPLLEIRQDAAVRDAQNLARILVDPGGSKDSLDVWDQQSSQLLVAVILHVLYTEPDERKHLGRVRELVMDIESTIDILERTCHVCGEDGEPVPHEEIARCAKSLRNQGERFRDSVRGTLEGYLTLWADPAIVTATSTSDFSASDLMCAEHPVSLYLEPPPSDSDRLRPLIRAMLFQISRTQMEHLHADNRGREKKHRLLLLLDEFPTLGKLGFMNDNLRGMAGYGIKAQLIVQSFADIAQNYGRDNTIIDNCYVVVAFAAADTDSAKRISEMLGTVTERRSSFSKRRAAPFAWNTRTESSSEQVRPLLTPAEVRELDETQQLVLLNGRPPFRTQKLRYYEEPLFQRRLHAPPSTEGGADRPGHWLAAGEWTGIRALDLLPPGGEEEESEAFEHAGASLGEEAGPPWLDHLVEEDSAPPPSSPWLFSSEAQEVAEWSGDAEPVVTREIAFEPEEPSAPEPAPAPTRAPEPEPRPEPEPAPPPEPTPGMRDTRALDI